MDMGLGRTRVISVRDFEQSACCRALMFCDKKAMNGGRRLEIPMARCEVK